MKNRLLNIIIVVALLQSCDRFNSNEAENAVARVNDTYLYKEDIKKIIPEGASKADSTLLANSFINNWASNLLLMDKAKLNLSETQQENYDDLVKQYETDLYTKAYLEALVKRSIDTTITKAEADKIYHRNKESFNDSFTMCKLV